MRFVASPRAFFLVYHTDSLALGTLSRRKDKDMACLPSNVLPLIFNLSALDSREEKCREGKFFGMKRWDAMQRVAYR